MGCTPHMPASCSLLPCHRTTAYCSSACYSKQLHHLAVVDVCPCCQLAAAQGKRLRLRRLFMYQRVPAGGVNAPDQHKWYTNILREHRACIHAGKQQLQQIITRPSQRAHPQALLITHIAFNVSLSTMVSSTLRCSRCADRMLGRSSTPASTGALHVPDKPSPLTKDRPGNQRSICVPSGDTLALVGRCEH